MNTPNDASFEQLEALHEGRPGFPWPELAKPQRLGPVVHSSPFEPTTRGPDRSPDPDEVAE